MADINAINPASTTQPSGSNTTQLSNAPVQQAPTTITPPAQVSGTVVSSNPQTQQLNIQTDQGQITLQTTASLPPNTPVTVAFSSSNGQTRATVTVQQQSVQQTQQTTQTLENAVQPPPTLQEGTTVTAVQLPQQPTTQVLQPAATTTATAATNIPVQIDQVAAALQSVQESGQQDVPLPLPQQQLQEALTTPNIKNFLQQLPPQMLRDVATYFAESGMIQKSAQTDTNPDTLRQLLAAYQPQKADAGGALPALNEQANPLDDNELQIMGAQLQSKAALENTLSPPVAGNTKQAAFSPFTTALDTLLSSSEESSQRTSGFSALLRQLIPQESSPSPQNMFHLQILKILAPGTTPAQLSAALKGLPASAQTGEVETTTSGGQPLLETVNDHFVLTNSASVPTGSKIIFTATPMTADEVMSAGLFTSPDSDASQNSGWPALQQALQALAPGGAQAGAAQALRNTIPSPTPQLVPTALFFLAALRTGSINNWLGTNTLQALQTTGQKSLAARLTDDFDKLADQTKNATTPGEWRSITIPLRYDEQISQMQFYVRQQPDQEQGKKDQADGKPATRFILNLALSRMGALQLDGFIQKKSFDVILRTEDKLPFDMRQALMQRFAQGLDQVQMQGGISFQTKQQNWVVPETKNTTAMA